MNIKELGVNKIRFLGEDFPVKSFTVEPNGDKRRTLILTGEEARVRALGYEICGPYIAMEEIDYDALLVGTEIVWENDVRWANCTYFTMHGEGFGLWSGNLKIKRQPEGNELIFHGETDYPVPAGKMTPVAFRIFVQGDMR